MITTVLLIPSFTGSSDDCVISVMVSDTGDGYEVTEQSKLVHDSFIMLHASLIMFICLCHARIVLAVSSCTCHVVLIVSCSSLLNNL